MKYILFFAICFAPMFIFSQMIEVVYLEQSQWDMDEEELGDIEYRNALLLAMEEKRPYKLLFNDSISIYEKIPKIDNSPNDGSRVEFSSSETFIFKDLKNRKIMYDQIYPKKYFILDSLTHMDWELTRETKEILGQKVYRANAEKDKFEIIAWYTKDISIAHGPQEFWGLPGLILSIEIKHERKNSIDTIIADKISMSTTAVKVPQTKNVKTYTKEEFKQIMKEFREKQDRFYGGGVDADD
ncbi:MAG: GLPGLI family protein [Weeksellaceae bacterium]|nr:GLPGLI family protein [Weeksellaceae bacterium]